MGKFYEKNEKSSRFRVFYNILFSLAVGIGFGVFLYFEEGNLTFSFLATGVSSIFIFIVMTFVVSKDVDFLKKSTVTEEDETTLLEVSHPRRKLIDGWVIIFFLIIAPWFLMAFGSILVEIVSQSIFSWDALLYGLIATLLFVIFFKTEIVTIFTDMGVKQNFRLFGLNYPGVLHRWSDISSYEVSKDVFKIKSSTSAEKFKPGEKSEQVRQLLDARIYNNMDNQAQSKKDNENQTSNS